MAKRYTVAAIAVAMTLGGCATTPSTRNVPDDICANFDVRQKEARLLCIEDNPFNTFEECEIAAIETLSDMFCGTQH